MLVPWLLWLLLGLILVQRWIELVIAHRNQVWILKQGGVEHFPQHYRWIVAMHTSWLVLWPVEASLRGSLLVAWWWTPLMFLVIAQCFRYGAMLSLGRYWNTRILVIPGTSPQARGLYRWLDHPNYVAVALELAFFPLLFGAWYAAIFFSLCNAVLLLGFRIPAEEKALGLTEFRSTAPSLHGT